MTAKSRLALLLAALTLPAASAGAQQIIFADIFVPDLTAGSIQSVHAGGGVVTPILTVGGGLRAVEVDASGMVYFADVDTFAVRRCNIDGSSVQDVITSGLAFPSALAIDHDDAKLFVADQTNELITRCNLDGSAQEPIEGTPVFRGIAVDTINNKMYWTTSITPTTGRIMRANLDGTEPEIVVPVSGPSFKPAALAIDPSGGKIYWTDSTTRTVGRAGLDGTGVETIFFAPDETTPRGIDVDPAGGYLYWGQETNSEGSITGFIMRSGLDGSEPTPIVIGGIGIPHDLVFVPEPGTDCRPDWDNSGTVNSADIAAYLTAWIASITNGDYLADFNFDLYVNSSDISAYLTAWLDAVTNGC